MLARSTLPALILLASIAAPATAAVSPVTVKYVVDSSWTSGFQATMTLTNGGTAPVTGWTFHFTYPHTIQSLWNGQIVYQGGGEYTVVNASWNGTIPVGGSVSFSFSAAKNVPMTDPSDGCVNGEPCSINGGPPPLQCAPVGGLPLPTGQVSANPSGRRIVGYFTAWSVYGRDYHVPEIPADAITHINYAFANIAADLTITLGDPYADVDKAYPGDTWEPGALRGNFNQLQILKEKHPHVKTLIAVGGWTWSGKFSDVALTAASRQKFAASCVDFMVKYEFDGVDIDWEYPVSGGLPGNKTRPEDKQNYTLLLQELRNQLDARGVIDDRHYLLTIAAPAGPDVYVNLELTKIHPIVDWLNLMAYDFHGSWSQITNFNAALYKSSTDPSTDPKIKNEFNGSTAVKAYLAAGVPADKLVLGAPFYGRGWQGVPDINHGLYQAYTGIPMGTWEPAAFDYEDLKHNYLPTYQRHFHPEAKVPWVYSPATGIMVSYDDPESIGIKADYAVANDLGGVMFWEFSADDEIHALTWTLNERLLTPSPYLMVGTGGGGTGDFVLDIWAFPPQATHILVLASASPAPGGPGTGPVLGLVPDPVFHFLAKVAPAPMNPMHFPTSSDPFKAGPWTLPPGTATVLMGTSWEMIAAAYDAQAGLVGVSGVVQIDW